MREKYRAFAEEYDVRKIVIFFSLCILIIAGIIIGIIFAIKDISNKSNKNTNMIKSKQEVQEVEADTITHAPITLDNMECEYILSEKVKLDIGEYIDNIEGEKDNGDNKLTIIRAEIKDEDGLYNYLTSKYEETDMELSQYPDTPIGQELSTASIKHRWHILGAEIANSGAATHDIFIAESKKGKVIYIIP